MSRWKILKRVPIAFFEDDGPVTPETRQAVRDAARTLEDPGLQRAALSTRRRSKKRDSCGGSFLSAAGPCFSIRWYGDGIAAEPDVS